MTPSREIIINELFTEISDWGISYTEAVAMNNEKWRKPSRTFDAYWAKALEKFKAANERRELALEEVRTEAEKERLKKAILTKDERLEILTQIAKGEIPLTKHIVCDGVIQERDVVPTWKDRKDAISEINKMEGDYAPIKKDITSGGNEIKQITGIIVE